MGDTSTVSYMVTPSPNTTTTINTNTADRQEDRRRPKTRQEDTLSAFHSCRLEYKIISVKRSISCYCIKSEEPINGCLTDTSIHRPSNTARPLTSTGGG